jgi:hypothetical protein
MAALCFTCVHSPLFEIHSGLMRFDHVAGITVNANHCAICVDGCVWLAIPQPTIWQRIGNLSCQGRAGCAGELSHGVGRGCGVGRGRGVGVGLGVGVGVVGVGVGVGVAPVPTKLNLPMRVCQSPLWAYWLMCQKSEPLEGSTSVLV